MSDRRNVALTPVEIVDAVRANLGTILHVSGSVFSGGRGSCAPGDVYLAALNPAGLPDPIYNVERSLSEWLDERRDSLWSAFLDESWPGHFQARMRALAAALGIDLRCSFSTNSFFVRTPGEEELRKFSHEGQVCQDLWSNVMWPCHQLFLNVVHPKLLICLGYQERFSARSWFLRSSLNGNRRFGHNLRTCLAPGVELFEDVEFHLSSDGAPPIQLTILALAHPTGGQQNLWPLDNDGVPRSPEQTAIFARAVGKLR